MSTNGVAIDADVGTGAAPDVQSIRELEPSEEVIEKAPEEQIDSESAVPSTRETSVEPDIQVSGATAEQDEPELAANVDGQTADTKTEPAATSAPVIPQKKKRLTLQERLAAAAAKGGKKTIKKSRDVSLDNTPRTSIDTDERPSLEIETNEEPKFKAEPEITSIPENYADLEQSALVEVVKALEQNFAKIKDQLAKEQSLNNELRTKLNTKDSELKDREARISDLSKNLTSNNSSVINKKLEEKENIIKELMEEGSKLSMKELNLSNTIKKLKSKAIEDGELMAELQEKLDATMEKAAAFEAKEVELKEFETKKEELTSGFKSLEAKHTKLQEEHARATQQFKDLKAQRFEQQLESTRAKLEEETKANKDLKMELSELNIRLKLFKDQSKHEVDELETKLNREQRRHATIQEESAHEIKRLEDKMESLRIMTESSNSSSHDDTSNETLKKLAASNQLLQSQYTAAQENWKFIESSYLTKLAQAEQDINTLRQKDLTSIKKIKALSSDLKTKSDSLEEALANETSLITELSELRSQIATKDAQIKNLEEKVQSLIKQTESLRSNFEKQLQEELEKQREDLEKEFEQQQKGSYDGPVQQQSLYFNDFLPNPSFLKSRSASGTSWNDHVAFGESSTTPRSTNVNSRKTSSAVLNQFTNQVRTPLGEQVFKFFDSPQPLDTSFNSSHQEESFMEDEFDEDYNTTVNSPASQHSSKYTLNNNNNNNKDTTPSFVASTSGAMNNKQVQIIGKLSSQLRRLEVESATLRDEIAHLNEDKNEANNEIVKLLQDNSEVQNLRIEKDTLERKVNELDKKYQRTLEILGEKSERVEELTADVADLKELCREQVQQLVDLQTK